MLGRNGLTVTEFAVVSSASVALKMGSQLPRPRSASLMAGGRSSAAELTITTAILAPQMVGG